MTPFDWRPGYRQRLLKPFFCIPGNRMKKYIKTCCQFATQLEMFINKDNIYSCFFIEKWRGLLWGNGQQHTGLAFQRSQVDPLSQCGSLNNGELFFNAPQFCPPSSINGYATVTQQVTCSGIKCGYCHLFQDACSVWKRRQYILKLPLVEALPPAVT